MFRRNELGVTEAYIIEPKVLISHLQNQNNLSFKVLAKFMHQSLKNFLRQKNIIQAW